MTIYVGRRFGVLVGVMLLGTAAVIGVIGLGGGAEAAAVAIPNIQLQEVGNGFDMPLNLVNSGVPGDERLFVVQQRGLIRILQPNGTVKATPFLDVSDRVSQSGSERGLLGLAFDPDFATTGYIYIDYTDNSGNTVVSRFGLSGPDTADANSEEIIIQVNQDFSNHNGGDIHFGPDGYLYIALGDGGSANDPNNRAQSLNQLLGSILRLDVRSAAGGSPDCGAGANANYTIPSSNPFTTTAGACNEIWAYGLRNPWRFSFDRQTGDLWIGDVGQNAREEINFQPAASAGGENYGWRCMEGGIPTPTLNPSLACNPPNDVLPVADYSHLFNAPDIERASVTGGYVYRGSAYPGLQGIYFFGDYVSGKMWVTQPDGQGGWTTSLLGEPLGRFELASFGENTAGELFVVAYGGRIYKIVDSGAAQLTLTKSAPAFVRPGELITYSLAVKNVSTLTATNVVISDALPLGANLVLAPGGTVANNVVTWGVGDLGPGAAATVQLVVTATQTLTNSSYGVLAENDITSTGQTAVTTFVWDNIVFLPLVRRP